MNPAVGLQGLLGFNPRSGERRLQSAGTNRPLLKPGFCERILEEGVGGIKRETGGLSRRRAYKAFQVFNREA